MKRNLLIIFVLLFTHLNAQHTWIRTNPGGGGAIAVTGATMDGTILAASDLSGIYRSYDNGASWDVLGANQGLLDTHISCFGFDPMDGDTFFAGTYSGVYKTDDGGEHFTQVFPDGTQDFEYSYAEDIAIAASNHQTGYLTHHEYADSFGEIYKTTDGGDTWHAIPGNDLPDDLHLIKISIHPTDADLVYVLTGKSRWGCSEANLYRSTDGGIHWVEIGAEEGDILDFDLHPTDPNTVFISTFVSVYTDSESCKEISLDVYYIDDESAGEFYKSTDGGASFTKIGEETGIISVHYEHPDTIRLVNIILPYDWNDEAGTWETHDGGDTWTHTGFVENWEKGYTKNQYFTFSPSYNGLCKTVTRDIFNNDRFYGAMGQWAWGSFDAGAHINNISTKEISPNHWLSTGLENINGHALNVNMDNPNVIYIGGYDIGFWYSTDHGNSWTRTQPDFNVYPQYSWDIGMPPEPASEAKHGAGANVMTILNDPHRENVVWASFSREQLTDTIEHQTANTGLFKSANYGEDWTLLNDGLPDFAHSVRMYGLSLDINSPIDNRTLYVTIDGNVYQSTDDGSSWHVVLTNGHLKFTAVDKFDGNLVYAGGAAGLWRTTDAGLHWAEVGTPEMRKTHERIRSDIAPTWIDWTDSDHPVYPWEGVFDIETDPNIANRVYATVLGENKGLYRSDDAGLTWTKILTDDEMRCVAITPANSDLIYATASMSYHSGGFGNSSGIQFSYDGGTTWQPANEGMAYNYAGQIVVENGDTPHVWVWSPGTGIQHSPVPVTTATNENRHMETVILSPNPVKNYLLVSGVRTSLQSIEIYDARGQPVFIDKSPNEKEQKIDVTRLPSGSYLVKTVTAEGMLTQKFIKE